MLEAHTVAAVLPVDAESAQDAISVATVAKVEGQTVVLMDGRTYHRQGEIYVSEDAATYIVEASRMHAEAVHQRTSQK